MLDLALLYTGEVWIRRCEDQGEVVYLVALERDGTGSVERTMLKALQQACQSWERRTPMAEVPDALLDPETRETRERTRRQTVRLKPVPPRGSDG